jgi:hypothetical protein
MVEKDLFKASLGHSSGPSPIYGGMGQWGIYPSIGGMSSVIVGWDVLAERVDSAVVLGTETVCLITF